MIGNADNQDPSFVCQSNIDTVRVLNVNNIDNSVEPDFYVPLRSCSHTEIAIAKAVTCDIAKLWVYSILILLFTLSDGEHQRKSNVAIAQCE